MKIEYKNLSHKKIWFDSMVGMTWGFLASLVIGTIIGLFGIEQNNQWSHITNVMKAALSYITPFAIGVGMGIKAKLNPIQIFAIGIGAFLVGHSLAIPHLVNGGSLNWDYNIGVDAEQALIWELGIGHPGDVFAAWLFGVMMIYFFTIIKWNSFLDIIIVPILGFIFGAASAMWLTYMTSTLLMLIEWLINNTINKQHWEAILLAPVIGMLMALALSLPTSSAAIALALSLHGDAATAAIAATSGVMISMGVMTYYATGKFSQGLAVGFASTMLQMKNFSKKPLILIVPSIIGALSALVAVASLPLDFPTSGVTSGMGSCGLYGQIFTLKENGWTNVNAWLNVTLIQLVMPLTLGLGAAYILTTKLGWVKAKDMDMTYE